MTEHERLEARYAFAARWCRGKTVAVEGAWPPGRTRLARVCRQVVPAGPADLLVAVEGADWRPAEWRAQAPELVAWTAGPPALEALYPHVRVFAEVSSETVVSSLPEVIELLMYVEGAPALGRVAVAAQRPLPESPPFVYLPADRNVLRERERHIVLLSEELKQKERWLEEAAQSLAALQRAHEDLERQAARNAQQAVETIRALDEENVRKTEWARALESDLERARTLLASAQAELQAQSEWALQLDRERTSLQEHIGRLDQRVIQLEEERAQALQQLAASEKELAERTAWARALEAEAGDLRRRLQAVLGSLAYRIGKRVGLCPVIDPPA